jgi:hypothetical protein
MGKKMNRILAALNLPENAAALVVAAIAMVDRVDGNSYFPHPVPQLAKIRQAIEVLREAAVVAESKMLGTATARDIVQGDLITLLKQLKSYVEGVAHDNHENAVAIIESAGMSVQRKGLRAKPPLAARNGRVQGEVRLVAKAVAKVTTYYWQLSEDDCKTWIDLPATKPAKTTVSGLVPGRTYSFRFRALTRTGMRDGSDAVSIIVQ